MITRKQLIQCGNDAKRDNAYILVLRSQGEVKLKPVPIQITEHWFGSKKIDFVSDEYTFDNIKDNEDVLKVFIPDDILKDPSINITVDQINNLINE